MKLRSLVKTICTVAMAVSIAAQAVGCSAESPQNDGAPRVEVKVFKGADQNVLWNAKLRYFKLGLFNPRALPPVVSPDCSRLAVAICAEQLSPNQVVVDGKHGKTYEGITELKFSPDSTILVYSAEKDDKEFMVINGKEATHYDTVSNIVFSPDSRRMAYTAEDYPSMLILDGKQIGSYDYIDPVSMVFSPDSKHFVYSAGSDHKQSIYLDGKKIDTFDEVAWFSVKFTPDSQTLTYTYRVGNQWFVNFGESKYGPYAEVDPIFIQISGDSKNIAIPVQIDDQWFLIYNDEKYGPYPWRPSSRFSPDSRQLAHIGGIDQGQDGRKVKVFLDAQMMGAYDSIWYETFSPDGKHFAFIANGDDKALLVIDGQLAAEDVSEFAYSPDGRRLVTVSSTDKGSVVSEAERKGKAYEAIWSLQFTLDSKHVVYWGKSGRESILVIDGLETVRFATDSIPELYFTETGVIRGAAVHTLQGDELKFTPDNLNNFKRYLDNTRYVLFELHEEGK